MQAESAVSKGLSAPVELVAPEGGEPPALYVVACGVSAYPGKMRLQYAASDALSRRFHSPHVREPRDLRQRHLLLWPDCFELSFRLS